MLDDTMANADNLAISVMRGSQQDPNTILLPPEQADNVGNF